MGRDVRGELSLERDGKRESLGQCWMEVYIDGGMILECFMHLTLM